MTAAIHQPDYIPYLGYFYKMAHSDLFVHLDDAQYSNEAAHDFNKIKTPQGECKLRIPVQQSLGDRIYEVRTKDELGWKKKHLRTLEMNYARAAQFKDLFPPFRELLLREYNSLADLNIAVNEWIAGEFGFSVKFLRSSQLNIHTKREDRVIDLCAAIGAETYLSGTGAAVYQSEEHFLSKNIALTYSQYTPVSYKQLWGDFLPYMSVLDYIFNCGFDWDYIERSLS